MQRLHGPNGPYRVSARGARRKVKVTFVTPDVAILRTRFWIEGEVMHDALSQEDRESVGTCVLRKIDGRWHIAATQNTDVRHCRRH